MDDLETAIINKSNKIRQRIENQKSDIKEKYNCNNSSLNFNPKFQHIEKSNYKGKICYIVVNNK